MVLAKTGDYHRVLLDCQVPACQLLTKLQRCKLVGCFACNFSLQVQMADVAHSSTAAS